MTKILLDNVPSHYFVRFGNCIIPSYRKKFTILWKFEANSLETNVQLTPEDTRDRTVGVIAAVDLEIIERSIACYSFHRGSAAILNIYRDNNL